MKKISKLFTMACVTVLLAVGLFSQEAQADKIAGNINFAGGALFDTNSAATATGITSWSGGQLAALLSLEDKPFVLGADGAFAGLAGEAVTFAAPWSFDSGASPFWSVGDFTFTLLYSAITSQSGTVGNGAVIVKGYGLLTAAGFEDTYALFTFSSQDPAAGTPAAFSFSAGSSTVPDGGSGVALLGIALVSVEGFRRKFAKA